MQPEFFKKTTFRFVLKSMNFRGFRNGFQNWASHKFNYINLKMNMSINHHHHLSRYNTQSLFWVKFWLSMAVDPNFCNLEVGRGEPGCISGKPACMSTRRLTDLSEQWVSMHAYARTVQLAHIELHAFGHES